jgi:hypothetical protein
MFQQYFTIKNRHVVVPMSGSNRCVRKSIWLMMIPVLIVNWKGNLLSMLFGLARGLRMFGVMPILVSRSVACSVIPSYPFLRSACFDSIRIWSVL